jgi:hypothetical protein
MPSQMGRWVLPVPGDPSKTTFSFATSRECLVRNHSRARPPAWSELRPADGGLRALADWEPRGPDPAFAAVGVACGDLTLQAIDQVLLMRPRLRAGPLGEPVHRFAQCGRLLRAGQLGDLGGQVLDRCGFGASRRHTTLIPWPCPSPNALSQSVATSGARRLRRQRHEDPGHPRRHHWRD